MFEKVFRKAYVDIFNSDWKIGLYATGILCFLLGLMSCAVSNEELRKEKEAQEKPAVESNEVAPGQNLGPGEKEI